MTSLITTEILAEGSAECAIGGVLVKTGLDTNANNMLSLMS